MRRLGGVIRHVSRLGLSSLLLAATLTMGTTLGFSGRPEPETIHASHVQGGNTIAVTLIIYDYTTPSEMQILSQAFEEGRDEGLVTALSETKAVGSCSISGDISFDVAFIQMVLTPTGRQITFITNRPLQFEDVNSATPSRPIDLVVGQFDLNDTDQTKSTGFLYPASKLVIDQQGEFHYDLGGSPWALVGVFDTNWPPALADSRARN